MYMSFETDDFHPPWRVMHLSLIPASHRSRHALGTRNLAENGRYVVHAGMYAVHAYYIPSRSRMYRAQAGCA